MTKLIKAFETLQAIQDVFETNGDKYAAVAYWSGGAGRRLRKMAGGDFHIVLDVNAGGTSARELRYLIKKFGEKVKVHPNLHSKIYASQKKALVGSSNASQPGLHLKPTSRVEASIFITGQTAAAAFEYAKHLFDAAEVAGDKHVEICRTKFMGKHLAEAEAIEGKVDFLAALWERRDLLDEVPLIITCEETDGDQVTREFNKARADLAEEGEDSNSLNQNEWTDFDWKLDKEYDGKLCITVHRKPRGGFWVALVRPVLTSSGERTFAKFLSWSEMNFFDYSGRRFQKIDGEKLEDFKSAFDEVRNLEGMVRVKDLGL